MISADELAVAIRNVRAVIQEHNVEPDMFVKFSPDADHSIYLMLSKHVSCAGIPTTQPAYLATLLKFVKIGIIIGLELAKGKRGEA